MKKIILFLTLSIFGLSFANEKPEYTIKNFLKTAKTGTPKLLKRFFKHGFKANAKNKAGRTPLMAAASSGNIQNFLTLLANGADIYQTNKTGQNAFAIAKEFNHDQEIKAILFGLNLMNQAQAA